MRFDLSAGHWREYEPPGLCHFGPELLATIGLGGLGAGAEVAGAATAASVLGGAAETALLTSAGIPVGVAAGLPAVPAAAAASTGILGTGIGFGDVLSAGGTLISAKAGMDNAAYQSAIAKAEAEALKQRANEEAAAGQRAAITKRRQAELVGSRARALAASSGTLATDPTEVNIESDIATQGEYNALSALYEGMAASRSSQFQADIDLFKARRISSAAPWAAAGTLFSGLSNIVNQRSRSSRLLSLYGA
jgi:hypothetical protein